MSQIETKFGTMTGDVSVKVTDPNGITPTNIIRMEDKWQVNVKWNLDGFLASMLAGTWDLVLYLESLGPQSEPIILDKKINFADGVGVNPNKLTYNFDFTFGPNVPAEEGVYKLVAVLTCKTPSNTPGPFAGFDAGPLLQFYTAP